jgi:hypothetical protein
MPFGIPHNFRDIAVVTEETLASMKNGLLSHLTEAARIRNGGTVYVSSPLSFSVKDAWNRCQS